jgi:DNA-directed RNA polymerase subunit M
MVSSHKKKAQNDGVPLLCPKCGYQKKMEDKISVTPKNVTRSSQESIAVIGKKEQKLRTLPTVRVECPKCGNNTAYAWQVQTRGTDESSTQFFRCTKCNYTFREYG